MMYLKQGTAVEVKLGPFVDETDGFTAETTLTITQADVRLAKEGGNWAQKTEATSPAHEEFGWYNCLLDTTDTDTLGTLIVAVHESGARPVNRTFTVLGANAYDQMINGTGDVAAVQTVVDDISTRIPNVLVANRMQSIACLFDGVADSGTTTTFVDAAITALPDDQIVGNYVQFLGGLAQYNTRLITDFDSTTNTVTFTPAATAAIANTDTYAILPHADGLSVATANIQADHVLRRNSANVEASSRGDALNFRSPAGAVAKLTNKIEISGGNLIIYQTDDTTSTAPGGTQAITAAPGADPIGALDTA